MLFILAFKENFALSSLQTNTSKGLSNRQVKVFPPPKKIVNSQSCAVKKQSHSCSLSSLYSSIFLAVGTKNTIKLHKQRTEEIHLQQNTRGTHLLSKPVIVLKYPCKMYVEKKLALFKLILNLFRVNFKAVDIVRTERLAFLCGGFSLSHMICPSQCPQGRRTA